MTLIEKKDSQPEKHLTVAILLFNGVEIIDYSGPWEVFGASGFAVHTVAAGPGPIKTVFGQRRVLVFSHDRDTSEAPWDLRPRSPVVNERRLLALNLGRAKEEAAEPPQARRAKRPVSRP
jgi:hypothetical protein